MSFRRLLFYAVTQPNAATGGGRHGQCVALNLVLGVFLRQAVCEGLERRATIVGAIDRSRSVSARALGPSHTQQSH